MSTDTLESEVEAPEAPQAPPASKTLPDTIYYVRHSEEGQRPVWVPTTKLADLFSVDPSDYLEFEVPRVSEYGSPRWDLTSVMVRFRTLDPDTPHVERYEDVAKVNDSYAPFRHRYAYSYAHGQADRDHVLVQVGVEYLPHFKLLDIPRVPDDLSLPGYTRTRWSQERGTSVNAPAIPSEELLAAVRAHGRVALTPPPRGSGHQSDFLDALAAMGLVFDPHEGVVLLDEAAAKARRARRQLRLDQERRSQERKAKAAAEAAAALRDYGEGILPRHVRNLVESVAQGAARALARAVYDHGCQDFIGHNYGRHKDASLAHNYRAIGRALTALRKLRVPKAVLAASLNTHWMGHPTYAMVGVYLAHQCGTPSRRRLREALRRVLAIYERAGLTE